MKNKSGKVIFYILLLGAVGTAGYLAYRRFFGKKQTSTGPDVTVNQGSNVTVLPGSTTDKPRVPPSIFPLQKGSRGTYVQTLQNALMSKYGGKSVLPIYGADGIWGNETQAALVKQNLATVIENESQYLNIIFPYRLPS